MPSTDAPAPLPTFALIPLAIGLLSTAAIAINHRAGWLAGVEFGATVALPILGALTWMFGAYNFRGPARRRWSWGARYRRRRAHRQSGARIDSGGRGLALTSAIIFGLAALCSLVPFVHAFAFTLSTADKGGGIALMVYEGVLLAGFAVPTWLLASEWWHLRPGEPGRRRSRVSDDEEDTDRRVDLRRRGELRQ